MMLLSRTLADGHIFNKSVEIENLTRKVVIVLGNGVNKINK